MPTSLLNYIKRSKLFKTAAFLIPFALAGCASEGRQVYNSPPCNEERVVECGHNSRGTKTETYNCQTESWEETSLCNDPDECQLDTEPVPFYSGPPGSQGKGLCQDGLKSCEDTPQGARYIVSREETLPQTETCDRLDNDCDDIVDNGFNAGDECTSGIGECAVTGRYVCASNGLETICNALAREPSPETCDGLDNDCDGDTDEEMVSPYQDCVLQIKECISKGLEYKICNGLEGWSTDYFDCDAPIIQPTAELCDNIDNDCNGSIDEGVTLKQPCGTSSLGECRFGNEYKHCLNGQYTGWQDCTAVLPTQEICDTLDNDCDGDTDEENICYDCPPNMLFVDATPPFCIDSSDQQNNYKDQAIADCESRRTGGHVCNVEEIDLAIAHSGIAPGHELATTESTGCCCPCGSYQGPSQHFWTPTGGVHGFIRGKCECWFENREGADTFYRCCLDL